MRQLKCIIVGTMILGALSGCSNKNVPLSPEGSQIKVVKTETLKKCQYLGKVFASDVNGMSQSYQSHEHLYQDELNTMKNQAALLGANTIKVTQHDVSFGGKNNTSLVSEHGLKGGAYLCK